ncbi:PEP-CTERM sorting domain-containing protein [Coraliomargarita sp. W4R72]
MLLLNQKSQLLSAVAVFSLLAATSSFAATYTWDGGAGDGRWDASAANWNDDIDPTFDNTADIKIAGEVQLDQIVRSSVTIRSLEFTSTNLGETTIGLIAANGTTARNLTFSADAGNSTLTIDALSTGTKTFNNLGSVILANDLDVIQNSTNTLDFTAAVTGTGDINLGGSGSGTMVFRGLNTFIGDLTIGTGHKVNAVDGSQLSFTVGDDGVNTGILGTGDLVLGGNLLLDLSSAVTTIGNSWQLVAVDTLNASNIFRNSFGIETVAGGVFTENSEIWSLTQGGIGYEFAEATGVLTVIPESGTYALLAGLSGLVFVMLRRRKA